MYKAIYEPYGKKNIINSRKPIEGVKYYEGIGSAAKSAIARGIPPEVINRDMGIVDIKFTMDSKKKKPIPLMLFTSDRGTKVTGVPRSNKPANKKINGNVGISVIRG
jgi:hypothetical protein